VSTQATDDAAWLGISDLNGDGKGGVLAVSYGGPHSQRVILMQYTNLQLEVMPGDFET
jgi:hypothetical protein